MLGRAGQHTRASAVHEKGKTRLQLQDVENVARRGA